VWEAGRADGLSEEGGVGDGHLTANRRVSERFVRLRGVKTKTPCNVFVLMLVCLKFSVTRNLL